MLVELGGDLSLKGLLGWYFVKLILINVFFVKDDVIILMCVDDCVILSKDKMKIEATMKFLDKRYAITDEGNMKKYLEIKLEHSGDIIRMSHPLSIEIIIDDVPGTRKENHVKFPALLSVILTRDKNGEKIKEN